MNVPKAVNKESRPEDKNISPQFCQEQQIFMTSTWLARNTLTSCYFVQLFGGLLTFEPQPDQYQLQLQCDQMVK